MSVFLSVQVVTGTSFSVYRYVVTIFGSSLSTKVIGSRLKPNAKNYIFYLTLLLVHVVRPLR